jgi:hypothetical protein
MALINSTKQARQSCKCSTERGPGSKASKQGAVHSRGCSLAASIETVLRVRCSRKTRRGYRAGLIFFNRRQLEITCFSCGSRSRECQNRQERATMMAQSCSDDRQGKESARNLHTAPPSVPLKAQCSPDEAIVFQQRRAADRATGRLRVQTWLIAVPIHCSFRKQDARGTCYRGSEIRSV